MNPTDPAILVVSLITAIAGSIVLAMGIVGYFKIRIGAPVRILLIIAGGLMLNQGLITDIAGVLTTAIIYVIISKKYKNIESGN